MADLQDFAKPLISTHHFRLGSKVSYPELSLMGPLLALYLAPLWTHVCSFLLLTVSRLYLSCMFILSPQRDKVFEDRDCILYLFCLPHNTQTWLTKGQTLTECCMSGNSLPPTHRSCGSRSVTPHAQRLWWDAGWWSGGCLGRVEAQLHHDGSLECCSAGRDLGDDPALLFH